MKSIGDIIMGMPKWALIMVVSVLFLIIGGILFFAVFKDEVEIEPVQTSRNVIKAFPDGETQVIDDKLSEIRSNRGNSDRNSAVSRYFDALGEKSAEKDNGSESDSGQMSSYDRSRLEAELRASGKYSEIEILSILQGITTREEIDRQHAEQERIEARNRREAEAEERRYKRETSDSAYFARTERAMRIAAKYSGMNNVEPVTETEKTEEKKGDEKEKKKEPRRINIASNGSSIKSRSIVGNDIVTSLTGNSIVGGVNNQDEGTVIAPVKATFLKHENIYSGNRVMMRLMQDLLLSDGTFMPANTHISGICSIGERMNIHINTISQGGKIYYVEMDVFDNDGTEGIYCPAVVENAQRKSARSVGRQVGQTGSQVIGSIASVANPYVGRIAQAGANGLLAFFDREGNLSITISPGYEFYIFEDLKEEKD